MTILRRRAPAPVEERATRINIAGGNGYGWLFANGEVGAGDALRSVAHWACHRVLCTSMAGLPVFQILESGTQHMRVEPAQIVRRPSSSVSQSGFVYQVMSSWLECGNVYGDIVAYDPAGRPTQIETIDPHQVSWVIRRNQWVPMVSGVEREVWPKGDLWHVPAFLRAGSPVGLSPTEYASQSIRTAVHAEKFGGDFFAQGAHPTAIIKSRTALNETQADQIKASVRRLIGSREPAVFGADLDWQNVQVNPADSQFLDLLRFEVEQAARTYGVPPSMIYGAVSGQSVTYANASQDDLSFLKHSLRWWVNLLQEAWSEFLPPMQYVKFNVDAMLQMTARERTEIHKMRLETKTRTVNEVRALEDEQPFDDPMYDEPGIPEHVMPDAQDLAVAGDDRPDPMQGVDANA
jgi:HK97 family phage portal protein